MPCDWGRTPAQPGDCIPEGCGMQSDAARDHKPSINPNGSDGDFGSSDGDTPGDLFGAGLSGTLKGQIKGGIYGCIGNATGGMTEDGNPGGSLYLGCGFVVGTPGAFRSQGQGGYTLGDPGPCGARFSFTYTAPGGRAGGFSMFITPTGSQRNYGYGAGSSSPGFSGSATGGYRMTFP
jgi:hypothetical protein